MKRMFCYVPSVASRQTERKWRLVFLRQQLRLITAQEAFSKYLTRTKLLMHCPLLALIVPSVGTILRFGGCFKQDRQTRPLLNFIDVLSVTTLGETIHNKKITKLKTISFIVRFTLYYSVFVILRSDVASRCVVLH